MVATRRRGWAHCPTHEPDDRPDRGAGALRGAPAARPPLARRRALPAAAGLALPDGSPAWLAGDGAAARAYWLAHVHQPAAPPLNRLKRSLKRPKRKIN